MELPALEFGGAEVEALALPIPSPGNTGFAVLVFLGQIVGARGELPPLMMRLFALCLLLFHGWLLGMIVCGVLDRRFPVSLRKSIIGLALCAVAVGALAVAGPLQSGRLGPAVALPLGAIGLLCAWLWSGRNDPMPSPARGGPPDTRVRRWTSWMAVIPVALLYGLLLTLGLHVVAAIGESFLPRNVLDPPFLRLAGYAAPFWPERVLLALLVPAVLVLTGSRCAPRGRRATSMVLGLLVAGTIFGGGAFAGWTFGRVYVASLLEPALTVAGLLLAIIYVWRQEGRTSAP
ncbi:MAG: hypothetical protein IPL39_12415 [Opitutaceae bacterium]|nr:hypothetical protein [Opitutaceae bacterium]